MKIQGAPVVQVDSGLGVTGNPVYQARVEANIAMPPCTTVFFRNSGV